MGCYDTTGSQLQVQLYVNTLEGELNEALFGAPGLESLRVHGAGGIRWVSPLRSRACVEYQDAAFLRAIEQESLVDELGEFWPRGGPVWDGLAVVDLTGGGTGAILVEGKSHTDELRGGGAKAGMPVRRDEPPSERSTANRERIARSLELTQESLGLVPDADRWMGRMYQTANRIAHQRWLAERGVPTWLVWLLFTDDQIGPTSEDEWEHAIDAANDELGLGGLQAVQPRPRLPPGAVGPAVTASGPAAPSGPEQRAEATLAELPRWIWDGRDPAHPG